MDDTSHTNSSSSLLADLSFVSSSSSTRRCWWRLVRQTLGWYGIGIQNLAVLYSYQFTTESSFETIVIEITGTYTRVSNVEMHPNGIIESSKLHGDSRLSRIYDTNACHLSTVRHELLQPVNTQWDTIPCKPTVGTNSIISYNRLHAFESNYSNFLIIIWLERLKCLRTCCLSDGLLAACLYMAESVCDIFSIVHCPIPYPLSTKMSVNSRVN
jgi:hypothetical protein